MYYAKKAGRNRYQLFSTKINQQHEDRHQLEQELRQALEQDQFEVYYQPIINLNACNEFGVEALIRWNHPDRGLILPSEFIPLAEETGLITLLSEWLLDVSCHQAQTWLMQGFPLTQLSVNISSAQLRDPRLPSKLHQILNSSKAPPEILVLDVTESMLLEASPRVTRTLLAIKELNIRFALDDFGSGYSSLNFLRHYPVDTLKIDRPFIQNINTESYDAAFVEGIIIMSHLLGIQVVAEGIETQSQLDQLKTMGCDFGQGFLWNKPLPLDQLEILLKARGLSSRYQAT